MRRRYRGGVRPCARRGSGSAGRRKPLGTHRIRGSEAPRNAPEHALRDNLPTASARQGTGGEGLPGMSDSTRLANSPLPGACLRSEEHTSELKSLMRISYAVFCLQKTNIKQT